MSCSSSTKCSSRVDEELLAKLELAGFEIDHALCFNKNPTLQIIYKWYTVGNSIMTEVEKMVNACKWPWELGKPPNQAEIIGLFVAKTTWYKSYVKVLDHLDNKDHKDMKAWLQEDPDSKPDNELWEGVGIGWSQYTLNDLDNWFDLQDKKKLTKKPAVAKKKGVEKEKTKETQVASKSGSRSGKGKERAKESVGGKKSHKKVTKG